MAVAQPSVVDLHFKAPDFDLLGVDGKYYSLQSFQGSSALVVMFICNHCPYVKAIRERLVQDTSELLKHGIQSVAVMSNDAADYPEDSFENMQKVAKEFSFPFPYLYDETQEVAKAYGAVCTPDFFGFNRDLHLRFRGRLDASNKSTAPNDARRELFEGMQYVANTGLAPDNQIPSIGCSIKWRR